MEETPLLFKELESHTFREYLIDRSPDEYRAGLELYKAIDGKGSHRLQDRFENCGTHAWFIRNKHTNEVKVKSPRCNLRECFRCIRVNRNIKAESVRPWMGEQRYLKKVELTLFHRGEGPAAMLKRLYAARRKLYGRKFWKERVIGSIWWLHAKYSWKSGTWHFHLHILVAGNFIPHSELKRIWFECTGDSDIVWIKPVIDIDTAIGDVARYVSSPADQTRLDLDQRLDMHHALKNRRCCGATGNAKGILLRPSPPDDGGDWERVGLFEFVSRNRFGDPYCSQIWKAWKQRKLYAGPEVQPESELYRDEADVMLNARDPPENKRKFFVRLRQLRNVINRGFDIAAQPAPF